MPKPFASSADLAEKEATLEQLADGVFAYTAQGDPNVGCIVGTDAILAIEARATPVMAQRWIDVIRAEVSDLPFGDLVLTHYHAVRTLGASAFGARRIVAHANTKSLIDERGEQDWASEQGRMPRLFLGAETIPGLTHPTLTFDDELTLDLGSRRVELRHLGRGHTDNDIVITVPDASVLFAGDLLENAAAPAFGDSYPIAWADTGRRMLSLIDGTVVPGHGDPFDIAFAERQVGELAALAALGSDVVNGDIGDGEAVAGSPFPSEVTRQAFERIRFELAAH